MSDGANDCDFLYPDSDDLSGEGTKARNEVHMDTSIVVHHGGNANLMKQPRAVEEVPWEANGLEYKHNGCLLYTSPSPRDS